MRTKLTAEIADRLIRTHTIEIGRLGPEAPVVSVCLLTFNHSGFIRQALDSVLTQEVDFPVEIIVGEDGSSDDTREIVLEYQERHPGRIRALLSTKNLAAFTGNGRLNLIRNLGACKGEYVALLEGDDYWTDPKKLQKQMDFLKGHPECALCCHNGWDLAEDGTSFDYMGALKPHSGSITYRDFVGVNFIPTASVVIRRTLLTSLPDEIYTAPAADWLLWAHLSRMGTLRYLDFQGSVRRRHAGGAYAGLDAVGRLENRIAVIECVNRMMNRIHRSEAKAAVADLYDRLVGLHRKSGRVRSALATALMAWRWEPTRGRRDEVRSLVVLFLRGRLDALWRRIAHA